MQKETTGIFAAKNVTASGRLHAGTDFSSPVCPLSVWNGLVNKTLQAAEPPSIEHLREQDLVEARAIQSAMLPEEALRTERVTIAHEFQPFKEVGGDFLDYFQLTDGTTGLYLGDVTGKGLPAAMYAALAVGTLRGVHKTGTAPAAVLRLFNKRLMIRGMSQRYSAVQYAALNPLTGEFRVAGAGMPGPVLVSVKGCREVSLQGIPAGMFAESEYEEREGKLEPGDALLFVSDGITDAMDCMEELFGMERLLETCEKERGMRPRELLSAIFTAVENFSRGHEQQDDRTATVLQYTGDRG